MRVEGPGLAAADAGPSRAVCVRSIETAVPPTVVRQPVLRDILATQPGASRLGQRLIRASFDASAVQTRHTVAPELDGAPGHSQPLLYDAQSNLVLAPSTGARNDAYAAQSPPLLVAAAKQAIDAAAGVQPDDVTHVITVSCTGFFAPGPDYVLVRQLGLRPSTERFHLGFMGCYGAFPALRMARSICRADPYAVVLIACVELCSLHLHAANDPDTIVASSVFADGAAAAIVSAQPLQHGEEVLELTAIETTLTPAGEDDMTWTIGDQGFDMVLSSYVPRIVEAHIAGALQPLLVGAGLPDRAPYDGVHRWAVHPGGRSILDRVETALALPGTALDSSREVLARYGNMSSATILFVLQALRRAPALTARERVCAMAFGPGLTVETALLTRAMAP